VGLQLLADGKGDVFVSAGNTGALFTGASLIVRKMKGVLRPAIGTLMPFDPPVLLLDSGANLVISEENMEQFAHMGSAYMKKMYGLEAPRVGILNNGEEECKGLELQINSYKRLSEDRDINFVGNIEGNKVMNNACDILVTDGFTGNILLKTVEGMGKMMLKIMKSIFYKNLISKISALLVKKSLGGVKKNFDPSEHGGAPILGVAKPVIKAHGSSNAKAIKSAIRQAIQYVNSGISEDIAADAAAFAEKRKAAKNAETVSTETK
jgi:glycerol-3-phosphate acyltransferase PlsX